MFGSGDIWDKSPFVIFENFKDIQKSYAQFVPNRPPKLVFTVTN